MISYTTVNGKIVIDLLQIGDLNRLILENFAWLSVEGFMVYHTCHNTLWEWLVWLYIYECWCNFAVHLSRISSKLLINGDAIWLWRSWSTLVQVMAWCLMASCHYLYQCWLIDNSIWRKEQTFVCAKGDNNINPQACIHPLNTYELAIYIL